MDAEQNIMRPGISRGWSLGRYDWREVEVKRDQWEVEVWCTTNKRGQIVGLQEFLMRDSRKWSSMSVGVMMGGEGRFAIQTGKLAPEFVYCLSAFLVSTPLSIWIQARTSRGFPEDRRRGNRY